MRYLTRKAAVVLADVLLGTKRSISPLPRVMYWVIYQRVIYQGYIRVAIEAMSWNKVGLLSLMEELKGCVLPWHP